MERYDNYKDSGVDWIGQIPEHWELMHLRNFISLFSEKGFGDLQLLSVTREKGVILRDKNNLEENHNFVPDDLSGYKHVKVGDFVINKMKSWQGSYGISKFEGIVSPAYYTCKLSGVNPEFFSNAIRSKIYSAFFMQFSKGVRVGQWDLDSNAMKSIPFILPPLSEQQAIVAYLDKETGKLDAAVEKLERMVEVLKERKQLIISKAVTRGLEDSVPLKDSGLEWIGQIPEHWSKQLIISKAVTRGLEDSVPLKDSGLEWIGQIPEHWTILQGKYLFSENKTLNDHQDRKVLSLSYGKIILKQLSNDGLLPATYDNYQLILKNYIVIRCTDLQNDKVSLRTAISKFDGIITNAYLALVPFSSTCPDYLNYLLRHWDNSKELYRYGSGVRQNLSWNDLKKLLLIVPPLYEQQAIAAYLDEKVGNLDEAIEKQLRMIELLKERKQILISDVVTGKIKVA